VPSSATRPHSLIGLALGIAERPSGRACAPARRGTPPVSLILGPARRWCRPGRGWTARPGVAGSA
jgi:hypothetical protein